MPVWMILMAGGAFYALYKMTVPAEKPVELAEPTTGVAGMPEARFGTGIATMAEMGHTQVMQAQAPEPPPEVSEMPAPVASAPDPGAIFEEPPHQHPDFRGSFDDIEIDPNLAGVNEMDPPEKDGMEDPEADDDYLINEEEVEEGTEGVDGEER